MNVRSEFHQNMKITGNDKMASAILTLAGAIANGEQTMEVKLVPGSTDPFELCLGSNRQTEPVRIRQMSIER